jgi:hypothetical protein
MDGTWQLVVAIAIVAGAGLCLLRRAIHLLTSRRGSAGSCGTGACAGCPAEKRAGSAPDGLVPVERLLERRQRP